MFAKSSSDIRVNMGVTPDRNQKLISKLYTAKEKNTGIVLILLKYQSAKIWQTLSHNMEL